MRTAIVLEDLEGVLSLVGGSEISVTRDDGDEHSIIECSEAALDCLRPLAGRRVRITRTLECTELS
jgi:hypothetical protein